MCFTFKSHELTVAVSVEKRQLPWTRGTKGFCSGNTDVPWFVVDPGPMQVWARSLNTGRSEGWEELS